MYCRKCKYDLTGYARHRCPECGKGFDPGRPRTFLASLEPRRISLAACAGCCIWVIGLPVFIAVFLSGLEGTVYEYSNMIILAGASAVIAALPALLLGFPLGCVGYALFEIRRRYLRRRWRAQSGLTDHWG
jgi:hypothetical protein